MDVIIDCVAFSRLQFQLGYYYYDCQAKNKNPVLCLPKIGKNKVYFATYSTQSRLVFLPSNKSGLRNSNFGQPFFTALVHRESLKQMGNGSEGALIPIIWCNKQFLGESTFSSFHLPIHVLPGNGSTINREPIQLQGVTHWCLWS